MKSVPVETDDVGRWIGRERRPGQLSDGIELLGWASAEDVDAPTTPVCQVGELVRRPVGVPARVAEDDILGNCVDHGSGFRDDDEPGFWIAGLNFPSSGNVFVDIVLFVDVADDADL